MQADTSSREHWELLGDQCVMYEEMREQESHIMNSTMVEVIVHGVSTLVRSHQYKQSQHV